MKKIVFVIITIMFISCEKEQEHPILSIVGNVYRATDLDNMSYAYGYKFVSETNVTFFRTYYTPALTIGETEIFPERYSIVEKANCTYEYNYPNLKIFNGKSTYSGIFSTVENNIPSVNLLSISNVKLSMTIVDENGEWWIAVSKLLD